jgi:hypothetical protein
LIANVIAIAITSGVEGCDEKRHARARYAEIVKIDKESAENYPGQIQTVSSCQIPEGDLSNFLWL